MSWQLCRLDTHQRAVSYMVALGHRLEILACQEELLNSRATQLQETTVCLLWRGAEP